MPQYTSTPETLDLDFKLWVVRALSILMEKEVNKHSSGIDNEIKSILEAFRGIRTTVLEEKYCKE